MSVKYNKRGDAEYASFAKSVRRDGKVVTEYTYLGKVVDKQQGLFFNKKLGYIVFDTVGKRIVPAPRNIIPIDALEEESAILDFGETFFMDNYMKSKGLMKCFESMGCGNMNTLCTLVLYYVLTHTRLDRSKRWYEGNYIREMYPGVELGRDNIVGFME